VVQDLLDQALGHGLEAGESVALRERDRGGNGNVEKLREKRKKRILFWRKLKLKWISSYFWQEKKRRKKGLIPKCEL